jgi:hypothetical protein
MNSKRAAALLLILSACGGKTSAELLSSGSGDGEGGSGVGAGEGDAQAGSGNGDGGPGTGDGYREGGAGVGDGYREAGAGMGDRDGQAGESDAGHSDGGTIIANDAGVRITPDGGKGTTAPDGGTKGPPDAGGFIDAPESDAAGAPTIGEDGYLSISAGPYVLVGYVSSFIGGSSSSIALTYGSSSFCASGIVGENGAYQSYAGAGFDVDQAQSSAGGSVSSLLLTGTDTTVSFVNYDDSPLELQLTSGSTYWCYELGQSRSPAVIPLTSFNTQCWDDGGDAFVPGTAITAIDLVVPGSANVSTPYGFCFLGLTIK